MQPEPSQNTQQNPEPILNYNTFSHQKPHNFYLKALNKQLTEFLEGGLHAGMITQIYGESGSGKTQMAMLFAISALCTNKVVGYLATEKELHWGRFTQLAYNYMNEAQFDERESLFKYKKCLDSYEAQLNFIEVTFKQIENSKRGGLIIIDNVYPFIDSSFTYFKIDNAYQRTRKQAQIINWIRKMAKQTNSCVLLINKVATVPNEKRRKSLNYRSTVPTLGSSWELNIDESMELKKNDRRQDLKELIVVHSPKCREGKILFRIEERGFVFVNEEGVEFD